MKKKRRTILQPAHIIPVSFLAAIVVGTLLLLIPACTTPGRHTSPLTALFTATTSVCVTGLVVVDTYAHWTTLGHAVILVLIQIGGLGIIAAVSTLTLLLRRRFSMRSYSLLHEAFNLQTRSGLAVFLKRVLVSTGIVEGFGAVLYAFALVPRYGWGRGIWYSAFTAISAFCNAGIDLFGPDSLIPFQTDSWMLFVTMLMIVLGGLGYVVWFDLSDTTKTAARRHYSPAQWWRRLSEHTRLVLVLTLMLIAAGAAVTMAAEWRNPATIGGMTPGGKMLNSVFQSVTLRTAGFAAVPQQGLTPVSCLLAYLMMFIGGSPVGTAGGVKTVTLCLVVLNAIAFVRGREEATVCRRKVHEDMLRKAAAIVTVSFLCTLALAILLFAVTDASLTDGLYEVISATATVGLSRGLTAGLPAAGKLIIIIGMYLGRIGPISMAVFFAKPATEENSITHAEGRFYVG